MIPEVGIEDARRLVEAGTHQWVQFDYPNENPKGSVAIRHWQWLEISEALVPVKPPYKDPEFRLGDVVRSALTDPREWVVVKKHSNGDLFVLLSEVFMGREIFTRGELPNELVVVKRLSDCRIVGSKEASFADESYRI